MGGGFLGGGVSFWGAGVFGWGGNVRVKRGGGAWW